MKKTKNLFFSIYIITVFSISAAAAADGNSLTTATTFKPLINPTLEIKRSTGPIIIDGELDDAGWLGAAIVTNFTQHEPRDMVKPPVETEAFLTFDDSHLYMAIKAYDDPKSIRSSLRDRDNIFQDDWAGFILDTYGDGSWAYEIYANPIGVQGDLRWTQSMEDISFDIIYESKGKITDDGYQIEFAIPFSSLRFPEESDPSWRVTFMRTRPRDSREQYSWAAIEIGNPCFSCQWGTMTGLKDIKPGSSFEFLPSLVGVQAGKRSSDEPNSEMKNDPFNSETSLGVRYGINSSTSAEVTFNPDFSQVESDAAQIDANTTFALFYPERRPFFQEGSDLLNTYYKVVYTRTLNDPSAAVKLTSRTSKTSFAYIGARDEKSPLLIPFEEGSKLIPDIGRSYSNILRTRHSFGDDSFVGALLTDRRLEKGGSGSNLSFDTRIRFNKIYYFKMQSSLSYTEEINDTSLTSDWNKTTFDDKGHTMGFDGESYTGFATFVNFERRTRNLILDWDYTDFSPTYRADNGFHTQNNYRSIGLFNMLDFFPDSRIITRFSPAIRARRVWNYDGLIKDNLVMARLQFNAIGQTYGSIYLAVGPERFKGIYFTDQKFMDVYLNSRFSEPLSLGFNFHKGRTVARFKDPPIYGDDLSWGIESTIKPTERFVVTNNFKSYKIDDIDGNELISGYILRVKSNYQFTRELFLRIIVQYDDFDRRLNFEPLLTYRINPFSKFYIGSTQGYSEYGEKEEIRLNDRQYFMKFQYLFRV